MSWRGDKSILFQEVLRHEPFWMLVACILVNRTKWSVAEPVFAAMRERWPTPYRLSWAGQREVEEVVRPLGFGTQRAVRLTQLALEWQRLYVLLHRRIETADEVLRLPGCGRYAADSWAIFIENRCDVQPKDKALQEYLGPLTEFFC